MSVKLDAEAARTGTRFRLFPQPRFLNAFRNPETVHINMPPGSIQAGPADDRMFVVDAINKDPYDQFSGPPFLGLHNPSVIPGSDGHFDHLDIDSREFSCATMYATVRRTLDIWEDYFGHSIPWHFEASFDRLEMIPLIDWDNAQSGFGFLEFGFGRTIAGGIDPTRPYCQNFDVLAHELGHSIIFSQVGVPSSPLDEGHRLRRHARISRRPRRHRRIAAFQLGRRSSARSDPRQPVHCQRARAHGRAVREPRDPVRIQQPAHVRRRRRAARSVGAADRRLLRRDGRDLPETAGRERPDLAEPGHAFDAGTRRLTGYRRDPGGVRRAVHGSRRGVQGGAAAGHATSSASCWRARGRGSIPIS